MAQTSKYGLPYQELTDPPDGASLGEDLAEAVEDELTRIDGTATGYGSRLDTLEGRFGTAGWSDFTADFVPASSGDFALTFAQYYVLDSILGFINMRVQYSGSTIDPGSGGNIQDTLMGTMPEYLRPGGTTVHVYVRIGGSVGDVRLDASGSIYLASTIPNNPITASAIDVRTFFPIGGS